MNYPIEINFKKGRLLLLLLAGIAFVAISAWFISMPDLNAPVPAGVIAIVGWAGLVFFGIITAYLIRMMLRKKPALSINTYGLHDYTSAVAARRIDWEDIDGIRSLTVFNQKFILVDVSNPEEYILRGEGKLAQKAMRANHQKYGTPIAIVTDNITMGHDELLTLLAGELKNYRALPDDLRMELREALPRELVKIEKRGNYT